jgi:hypothetical protein
LPWDIELVHGHDLVKDAVEVNLREIRGTTLDRGCQVCCCLSPLQGGLDQKAELQRVKLTELYKG